MLERDSFSYTSGHFRNAPKFSCLECPFYVFHQEAAMLAHCRKKNHGRVKDGALTNEQFIEEYKETAPKGVIITLAYLCWNTAKASAEGLTALMEEAERLKMLGLKVLIEVLDNGSQDGTGAALGQALSDFPKWPTSVTIRMEQSNLGISRGRNYLIERALSTKSDYILFMDGDIEIVPLSAFTMTRYLECHKELGCIGAYSSNYTNDREKTAKRLTEIAECRVKGDINCAWTQYGLFRMEMFRQGMRFDTDGPMGEPGWGFEDDDLCFQMIEKGWGNKYFGGMKYLHRNLRSSWPNLEASGIDVGAMFKKRQAFLLYKWQKRGFDSGKLRAIKAQQLPVRVF